MEKIWGGALYIVFCVVVRASPFVSGRPDDYTSTSQQERLFALFGSIVYASLRRAVRLLLDACFCGADTETLCT